MQSCLQLFQLVPIAEQCLTMKKCERCSKPSVLHITEIRHGEVQARHLCESCAKEYLNQPVSATSPSEAVAASLAETDDDVDDLTCPECGMTFKEFRANGRLGCANDYQVFRGELLSLLENIHGETQHVGKVPKRAPDASQKQYRLIKLRSRLRAAVDDEQYEEAARLRDEISALEAESAD